MLRFLLTPRRVGLHVAAVLLVVVMVWLGFWQLHRALDAAGPSTVADPAAVPLDRLSVAGQALPGQAYGRRVTAHGTYDAEGQVLVVDRDRGGTSGFWVMTPLRLGDGSGLAVVRGWVPRPEAGAVDAVPTGEVTVTGRAYPSEQPADAAADLAGPGRAALANPTEIAPRVAYAVRDGFVVATGERPAPAAAPARVVAKPWPSKGGGFPLQNSAYAVQWWLFSLFTVFMWWRVLREGWRREHAPDPGPDADVPAGQADPLPR